FDFLLLLHDDSLSETAQDRIAPVNQFHLRHFWGQANSVPHRASGANCAARSVLAIANGTTAEQGVSGRNLPSTRFPARSWLIRDSLVVHCRFGLLALAESILQPLLDNYLELTLCSPLIVNPTAFVGVELLSP